MLDLFRNKKIMIVVAHPDDELLGLGATLNKLIKEYNVKTHVVILGEGITSRSDKRDIKKWEKELKNHKKDIISSQKVIGYHSNSIYDFPDNRFDSVDLLDIIKVIEKEKKIFDPEIIFTHHSGDLNIDHQKTFEGVMIACRPLKNENVKTIITFETPSGTEWMASSDPKKFHPNLFIELSKNNLDAKIEAMECYKYEKRLYPHPRSPEALLISAKQKGLIVGKKYAEAFYIVRSVN